MKLLGWMHRKLRQNTAEPLKNIKIVSGSSSTCFSGQSSLDEQNFYAEQTNGFSPSWHPNVKVRPSFDGDSLEPFHGFLAIGTLGSELLDTDPPTPTFPMPSENATDEEVEIMDNDLKFINFELEKFLDAEAKEDGKDSSRSSQASIITLCDKPIEGADSEGYKNMVACPLQDYLFASSIGLAETGKGKKEKITLGGLFERTKTIQEQPRGKCKGSKKEDTGRQVKDYMKKMLKKLHFISSKGVETSNGDPSKLVSTKRKLSGVLQNFHRKVHPEESITINQFYKSRKGKIKNISKAEGYQHGGVNESKRFPQAATRKNEKSTIKQSSLGVDRSIPTVTREHWINTDADYLVLEL